MASVGTAAINYAAYGPRMPYRPSDLALGNDNLLSALNFIREGQMRALAVTSRERSPVLPDVPSLHEAGVTDLDATSWFGVQALARTPEPIVARMGQGMDTIVRSPDWTARMRDFAAEPPRPTPDGGTTPQVFAPFTRAEIARRVDVTRVSRMSFEQPTTGGRPDA